MTRTIRYILIAVLLIALSGCGYTVKRSPVGSVRIGDIVNMTNEAKVDDWMVEALTSSFLRNGIRVSGGAGHTVEGSIESLSLYQLAEHDKVTTSYRVVIKGKLSLVAPDGKKTKLPESGKYIVTFRSTEALTPVIANKELAIQRALSDWAEEISAAVLYME